MSLKFVRNSITNRIFHATTRRVTKIAELLVFHREGVAFELVDEKGNDIKELALSKHKGNMPYAEDPEVYGSPAPLFETKLYACLDCDRMNPNRYRCSVCWGAFSDHNDTSATYY